MLLPRMIEDMLKLTVDVVFPKSSIRKVKKQKEPKRTMSKQAKPEEAAQKLECQSPTKTDSQDKTPSKQEPGCKRIHPVTGYADTENMWQKLASLEKDTIPTKNKFPNKRSQYMIQVSDKVFRLKRNPAYQDDLGTHAQHAAFRDLGGDLETVS